MVKEQKQEQAETLVSTVLQVFRRYPNQHITLNEIVTETGLTRTQVSTAVWGLRRNGVWVQTMSRGVYLYVPGKTLPVDVRPSRLTGAPDALEAVQEAPTDAVEPPATSIITRNASAVYFEEVGKMTDGTILVRDEQGKIGKVLYL